MNLLARLFQSRASPKNQVGGRQFYFGRSSAGKNVSERTALQTTAVYACVRILSETIASLPLHTYKYTEDAGSPCGSKEKDYTHPLYYLLHDEPNDEMTSFAFRETLMSHLLIYGNAYAQIIRDGRGRVLSLYPLLPDKMRVDRGVNKQIYYTYSSDEEGQIPLRKEEVLHIPGLGYDGLVGYSPIAMTKNAVGLSIAAEEYGSKFFANGANPGGVLEHPGQLKDPERVRDSWNSVYGGSNNSNRVAVLEEGLSFKSISIPPEQAQFLETRKFQVNEICRIFRVPPHMVADLEKSSFSNIEQQSLDFVVNTVRPWLVRWEQAIGQKLLLPNEKGKTFVKFNVDGLLRGDFQSRMTGYSIARQNGWMSADDIRELENMNKLPKGKGGDKYLVNGNMVPIIKAQQNGGDTVEQILEV